MAVERGRSHELVGSMVGAASSHVLGSLTGDTADGYVRWVIASRFRVCSEQARAASLAVTVWVAAPADLLRRGARVSLASCMLVQVGRRDRFNLLHIEIKWSLKKFASWKLEPMLDIKTPINHFWADKLTLRHLILTTETMNESYCSIKLFEINAVLERYTFNNKIWKYVKRKPFSHRTHDSLFPRVHHVVAVFITLYLFAFFGFFVVFSVPFYSYRSFIRKPVKTPPSGYILYIHINLNDHTVLLFLRSCVS